MRPATAWLAAIRPKTLGLSVSPVLVGTSLALTVQTTLAWLPALAALAAAVLIQIGTNLHNDAADFHRGTDTHERLGPPRATAQGWLSPGQVAHGAKIAFLLAFLTGIYLVAVGGWPILLLGLGSLAAGAAYSGGPWPISASPLGELFVLLFFGLAAVAGSYYLQTSMVSGDALLAGVIMGLPAAAVLVVNNFRDRDSDRRAGRRTLAVLLPESLSRLEYALLLLLSFPLLWSLTDKAALLPLVLLLWAVHLIYRMFTLPRGGQLNGVLVSTARLQTLFGLLLSLGFLLDAAV